MSRINWDYVFGLVMGAVVCTACNKLYERGVDDGIKKCARTTAMLADLTEDKSEEKDEEES